jgi:purine-binding chemotaxis protein CheW
MNLTHADPASSCEENGSIEFLTFLLSHEIYGLEIRKVQEIHGYEHVIQIECPSSMQMGVINLRGRQIPILDLRQKSQSMQPEYDALTNVIVVKAGKQTLGIVVDGVSDVVSTQSDQIRIVSAIEASIDHKYMSGLLNIDENTIMLLDIDKFMNSEDVKSLQSEIVK